ncbi:hypothetical protein P0F65_12035 [Sphingomonas sp. I4]
MTSITMKTIFLAGLATVLTAGTAQAQFAGGSSDPSKVTVGASNVNGGPMCQGVPGSACRPPTDGASISRD